MQLPPGGSTVPSPTQPSRRGVLAAGALLLSASSTAASSPSSPFRVVHLTDLHISPDPVSIQGVERALASSQGHKPDLLLLGGDIILDGVDAPYGWAVRQWEVFRRVLNQASNLPVEACLGNHDLWGGQGGAGSQRDRMGGKAMALDYLGLKRSYRSFDRGGWHFVVLDSILATENGYTARLEESQYQWLVKDLAGVPAGRPILVLSHVPIAAICSFFDGPNERPSGWHVSGTLMHTDARRLKDLFRHHNIKLCLSGHIHLADVVRYLGVTYACSGAVSSGWWKGRNQEFGNGYAIVDLYPDGSFDYRYHEFTP